MTNVKRGRGRPSNVEIYGDAAKDPLQMLVDLYNMQYLLDGTTEEPVVQVDLRKSGLIRRHLRRASKAPMMSPARKRPQTPTSAYTLRIAKGAGKRRKKAVAPDHLQTETVDMKHEWSTNLGLGTQKTEVRASKNSLHKIRTRLASWKCMDGAHVDMFLSDWESCQTDLRSPSLEGAGTGGKAMHISERKLEAAGNISQLRTVVGHGQFDLIVAVLIFGATPTDLHARGAEQHTVVTRQIKDAIDNLMRFYTPEAIVHNRTWDAAREIVNMNERQRSSD